MPSINFNPAGISALQNFNLAQGNLASIQVQIATGKRVQASEDDPAVMATSQRLIAYKEGLKIGIDNTQEGDKLLATAEKALSNMQDILQNMRQLAVKSSNDATTDADRVNYQKQIDDYRKELDRIARDTRYKERHLLNGDMKSSRPPKDADGTLLTNIIVNESTIQGTSPTFLMGTEVTVDKTNFKDVTFQVKLVINGSSIDAQIYASDTSDSYQPVFTARGLDSINSTSGSIVTLSDYGNAQMTFYKVDASTDAGKTAVLRITSQDKGESDDKSISFQIGANAGEEINVGIGDVSSYGLRITRLDVSTVLAAKNSVSMIDDAIERVSVERSSLGSLQNRLKVSISNGETYKMSLQGTLSQEVDADYTEAILQQSMEQVKQQASLAMLTQANQSQQAVLGLLQ